MPRLRHDAPSDPPFLSFLMAASGMSLSGICLRGPARSASGIHLETLATVGRLEADLAGPRRQIPLKDMHEAAITKKGGGHWVHHDAIGAR